MLASTQSAGEAGVNVAGRPRRWIRWLLKRLLALFLGLLVAGFLSEICVRVFLGRQVKFPRRVVEAPWGLRYNQPNSH